MSDRGGIGGGGGGPAPLDGGAFLLQLLRRPPQPQPASPAAPPLPYSDPAVAAVGPSYPFPPHRSLAPAGAPHPPPDHYQEPHRFPPPHQLSRGPWPQSGFPPHGADYSIRPSPSDPGVFPQRDGVRADNSVHNYQVYGAGSSRGPAERNMPNAARPMFQKAMAANGAGVDGGVRADNSSHGFQSYKGGSSRGPVERNMPNTARPVFRKATAVNGAGVACRQEMGKGLHPGPRRQEPFPRFRTAEQERPLVSFHGPRPPAEWVALKGRQDGVHSVEQVEDYRRKENSWSSPSCSEADQLHVERLGSRGSHGGGHPNLQRDQSGDAAGINLHYGKRSVGEGYLNNSKHDDIEVTVSEIQRSMKNGAVDDFASRGDVSEEQNLLADQLMNSLELKDDPFDKKVTKHRGKDLRSDSFRGHHVSSHRMRIHKREIECRYGIEGFTSSFISVYESLVPAEAEKEKQKQLLLMLENIVAKEWPNAQLHVYGSCANSFGFSNSDIDICLAINDINMSKSEILLKLADILQADNLENVQALTHARVPIVKMMDPVTGISCDICINNLLAVVNTKLLRDYAQIDARLPQLAFIVKHWAKSRGVNETYRGTLSSYAYVLMCIHFLQLRKPAILPCLQEMEATHVVTIDDTRCAYFDRVEKLHGFGAQNKENIVQLLWAFFHYWAYYHDYTDSVISVRAGRIISKRMKDWTRRIGNDRHLICIEDPFETSHDLGRVVDKFSIKILREEFERAADILQYDLDPRVTLFEPYVPVPIHN